MSAPARLRALRMVGFKSFAEKTAVEFGAGEHGGGRDGARVMTGARRGPGP